MVRSIAARRRSTISRSMPNLPLTNTLARFNESICVRVKLLIRLTLFHIR